MSGKDISGGMGRRNALGLGVGAGVIEDVPNFASGGATVIVAPLE